MNESRLMSVRSDVVKETLVERISDRVVARLPGELPAEVCAALDDGLEAEGNTGSSELSAQMARAGYLTRIVEAELFEPARAPMPGLAEQLCARLERGAPWHAAAAEVARQLASGEPLHRPDPGDVGAASWRVPGPGGHVRHYVADRLAGRLPSTHGGSVDQARPSASKRDFMYGFFVRCCEEVG